MPLHRHLADPRQRHVRPLHRHVRGGEQSATYNRGGGGGRGMISYDFFRREVLQISILKDKILKVSLENRKQDLQNVLPTFVNN